MGKVKTLVCLSLIFLLPGIALSEELRNLAEKLGKELKNTDVKIAVMDFTVAAGERAQDSVVIRERLTTFLAQSKNIAIIERALLEKIFQEQKIEASGALEENTAQKIGKLTGADAILTGTLSELYSDKIEVNARVIAVATGKIITAGQATVSRDWKYFLPPSINKTENVSADSAQDYYRRGTQYYGEGKYNMALEFYSRAIKLKPDYTEAYNARGSIYSIKGNGKEAISDFSKAIEYELDSVEGYSGRAMAYSSMGEYAKAIQDFDKTIELTPVSTKTLTAEAFLDSFIPDAPDYIGNYEKRGNAYLANNDPDSAIRDYTKIIELRPDNRYFYTLRGNAYYRKGDFDAALPDYNKAIILTPESIVIDLSGLPDKPDPKEGVIKSSTVVDNSLEQMSAYSSRGDVYYAKGDFEGAIKDYTTAISLLPKRVKRQVSKELPPRWEDTKPVIDGGSTYVNYVPEEAMYISRGNAYFMLAKYDKAIADYDEAIELNTFDYSDNLGPKNPRKSMAYANRGNAYFSKGEVGKAAADCEKAIELDPSNANAYSCREAVLGRNKK